MGFMRLRKIFNYLLPLILIAENSFADETVQSKSFEERKADLKAACDTCAKGVKKDPGEWDLSLAFGFNLTSGNSDTTLLTGQTKALREIDQDIYNLEFNGAYGKQDSVDTQKYIRGDAGYKRLLNERLYLAASVGHLSDDIANIDYRLQLNPGVGYFLIKSEVTTFNLEAGPSYLFQKLDSEKSNFVAGRIANNFEWKLSETAKIFQTTEYVLNLEDTNESIVNAGAGIEASLTSKLALVWAIRDRLNTQPAEGLEKNDVIITSALKVSL